MKYCFTLFYIILQWNIAQPRIVSRRQSIDSPYSYMVEINFNGKKICDGTIISGDWILTAAHCTHGLDEDDLSVSYGSTVSGMGCEEHVVENIEHPSYNPETKDNNVALLKLGHKIDLEPVKLSEPDFSLDEDDIAKFPGWGVYNEDGEESCHFLDAAEISILGKDECEDHEVTKQTIICGEGSPGNGHFCPISEGGGPLIYEDKQVGIAFPATDCHHVLFISISESGIRDFIKETAGV